MAANDKDANVQMLKFILLFYSMNMCRVWVCVCGCAYVNELDSAIATDGGICTRLQLKSPPQFRLVFLFFVFTMMATTEVVKAVAAYSSVRRNVNHCLMHTTGD